MGFRSGWRSRSGAPQERILIQLELPPASVVPTARGFKYVRTRDEIQELARPKKEIDDLYRLVISQLALLSIRNVFEADPDLSSVGFNGCAHATDPATGRQEYPCLISLLVSREDSVGLVLDKVEPALRLRKLQAIVSVHPFALEGIEPILDYKLTKYSFVEGLDAVATLDSRPDLMKMAPTLFEHLVKQLFEALPEFESWTTTQSKDDGVDAVVTNKTALVGGQAIVQAKRYSRVIGPSHIRELVGAMDEKRAGKGILVTTSWFTPGIWQKARENGRVELIDGPRLVYLIKEHLGKQVVIGLDFPASVLNRKHEPSGDT